MPNDFGLKPQRAVIIDIDGLRRDVFLAALERVEVPNIARLVGGPGGELAQHVEAVSVAPSITFAAQASIFTGAHPGQHRIAGNENFDRLGYISDGVPRHFGFDIGDTLAVDDAVAVFREGLASALLSPDTPTLYETFAEKGQSSVVAYNMYARGADEWVRPSLVDIARFTKGKGVLGMEAGKYDAEMLRDLRKALTSERAVRPDLLTVYFMGLDHHSHLHGPSTQREYLLGVIDPQIGNLLEMLTELDLMAGTLFVFVSDHGQIECTGDDRHSIRLGFPFDPELSDFFKSLGLDVHDLPGEDPACDAVVGLNGGLAHVYLRHPRGEWAEMPRYEEDVLRVAEACRQMNLTGAYEPELQGSLEMIAVRDAAGEGSWEAEYRAYVGDGRTQPLPDWLADHPELPYVDAVNRLRLAASSMSGDIILSAKGSEGFYFGGEGLCGVHGSLYPDDSETVLTFAYPDGTPDEIAALRETVTGLIGDRCANEGNRRPSVADMAPMVRALLLD